MPSQRLFHRSPWPSEPEIPIFNPSQGIFLISLVFLLPSCNAIDDVNFFKFEGEQRKCLQKIFVKIS